MEINIILLALHLFQILSKFRKEIQHLIMVSYKLRKKNTISLIFKKEEKLYTEVNYLKQNMVNINQTFF